MTRNKIIIVDITGSGKNGWQVGIIGSESSGFCYRTPGGMSYNEAFLGAVRKLREEGFLGRITDGHSDKMTVLSYIERIESSVFIGDLGISDEIDSIKRKMRS